MPEKNGSCESLDLIVCGQVTRDYVSAGNTSLERIGGIAYAASAASRWGLQVGLVGTLCDDHPNSVVSELVERHLNCSGLKINLGPAVEYKIMGADEVHEPNVLTSGPEMVSWPGSVPDMFKSARLALIYPVNLNYAYMTAESLNARGVEVAVDIQHDLKSLSDAEDLLRIASYIMCSEQSFLRLTETDSVESGVDSVRRISRATIVVKMGARGSIIFAKDEVLRVPAFQSDFRITVGAGDAYDAIFLAERIKGMSLSESGISASRAAAAVIESTARDPSSMLENWGIQRDRHAVFIDTSDARAMQIYIAGHFHSLPIRRYIDSVARAVERAGFSTFVPHRDVGVVGKNTQSRTAFEEDLNGLRSSKCLIALLDNAMRGGTYLEIGVALERKIPVIVVRTDSTLGVSNMVKNASTAICVDIKSAINPLIAELSTWEM